MQTISIQIPDEFSSIDHTDQALLVIPLPDNWKELLKDDVSVKLFIDNISDGNTFGYIARRIT